MITGWSADFLSAPDRDFNTVDVLFDEQEVASIKKLNGEMVISYRKTEKDFDIPLDWFLGLLQEAKNRIG